MVCFAYFIQCLFFQEEENLFLHANQWKCPLAEVGFPVYNLQLLLFENVGCKTVQCGGTCLLLVWEIKAAES